MSNTVPTTQTSQDVWFLESMHSTLGYQRHVTICSYPFRIGRGGDVMLCLPVSGVSKAHAEIRRDNGQLWLHDLNSTNGTFVNGEQVLDPHLLHEGDVIQFADQGFQLGCWSDRSLDKTVQSSPVEQALYREVAERRRATETLMDREAHWKTVLEMLNDGVVIFDAAGVIETVNPSALALFGYQAGELQGSSIQQLVAPEHRAESFTEWMHRQETTILVSEHREVLGLHKDQTPFPVQLSLSEINLTHRHVYVAIFRNMTAWYEKEALLREATRQAQQANESKSAFMARVSHDLRTPLTAIIGYADMLQLDGRSDELWRDAVPVILRNSQQALSLLNDLLDLAKIESGKLELDPQLCNPAELVSEVLQLVQVQAEEKKLRLYQQFYHPLPVRMLVDASRLTQILTNLLSNAIKFTEEGSVLVELKELIEPPQLQFRISDTGRGMTPQQLARLAEPYFQGNGSSGRGIGLGLNICQSLIRLMGGALQFESDSGHGTTATFTLPLQVLPRQELASVSLSAPHPTAGRSYHDMDVLLVDDHEENVLILKLLMEKLGANVSVAHDGQNAVRMAMTRHREGNPYDVVFMDLQMPGMNGFSAVAQLRGEGYLGWITALTADALTETRDRCLEGGFDDYLTKPTTRQHLAGYLSEQRGERENSPPARTSETRPQ